MTVYIGKNYTWTVLQLSDLNTKTQTTREKIFSHNHLWFGIFPLITDILRLRFSDIFISAILRIMRQIYPHPLSMRKCIVY